MGAPVGAFCARLRRTATFRGSEAAGPSQTSESLHSFSLSLYFVTISKEARTQVH